MTLYLVSLCQWKQRVMLIMNKRSYLKGFKMKLILKTINPNQVHKFRVIKVLKKSPQKRTNLVQKVKTIKPLANLTINSMIVNKVLLSFKKLKQLVSDNV